MNENEGESMIKAFSAFFLTTIISFVVMVGALLIWVTIQGNHITDPSLADGLGFAVAYGVIAAVPVSLAIGIFGGIIGYLRN
ncbi:hypothetical protein [Priestia aryabhattai]|uniref:hypothetical protein n=1 Tax=Priestia aryabhattai TaxID=412384 RepID=UPI0011135037|nr:hypothetical protein [Priestia aryabhattai]